ncbi:hypothetical protein [Fibrobacter sp.]|uniref:hypothetical protein n=1 Tax=Fibrobacter sp. TaxID=35828 RepID=UPI00388FF865
MKKIYQMNTERGLKMLRFTGTILLSAVAFAAASVNATNAAKIDSTIESIESKKGVDIGGTVRAVYNNSHLSSDQDVNAYNVMSDREVMEFVQMDLDFGFRPWDNVRVNAKMRTFAGMQDYFAASATSVTFPWLNVEGNVGESFYWVVGDFRSQISPLTVYAPGVDIMYEPMIFARNKEIARGDAMLEGNQRNLQGVNLQFRRGLGETLGEIRAEAFAARLRRGEYLDFSGYEGNLLPNEGIPGASQAGNYDKYAINGNLEWFPMNRNLMVAGTYLWIVDDENSINRSYFFDQQNQIFNYLPTNYLDSLPQNTKVVSGRFGGDVAGFLGNKNLILDLTGEVAMSMDEVYKYQENGTNEEGVVLYKPVKEDDKGMAANVELQAGYKTDLWNARINAAYIYNDSSWYNNMAQSPSFVARRILNTDKDGNLTKYGTYAPLYSSFDAMYYFTPRHSPLSSSLANASPLNNKFQKEQNKSYNIAPYSKTSYTTAVFTRNELALLDELSDPALQMALPNGLATTNRTGAKVNLVAGFGKDNAIEAQGLFVMQEQVKSILPSGEKAKYTEMGGGAKVDVLKLLGFNTILELSGSYKYSTKEIDKASMNSDFINGGLYWRYFKRFGVSAGFQMIRTNINSGMANFEQAMTSNLNVSVAPIMQGRQMQWMVGLDYTLAPHAWLSMNYGQISVENKYRTRGLTLGETNVPDYIAALPDNDGASKITHEFTQSIIDARINIEF